MAGRKSKDKGENGVDNTQLEIKVIARLWVKWNIGEITGDDFALRIRKLLKKETAKAWGKYLSDKTFICDSCLENLLI